MSGFADDVYQPDPTDQVEVDQLDDSDTLIDGVGDPLDEGYSPIEKPMGLRGVQTLEQRLADELPDIAGDDGWDGLGDSVGTDGELYDDQVGGRRAGRLVAPDGDGGWSTEKDLVARDIGIDGAGASAEEAAVHVVDGEEELQDD